MKIPVGKTFVVAASLLGLAAVAQLVAIMVYFSPKLTAAEEIAPASTPEIAATPAPTPEPEPSPATDPDQAARLVSLMQEAEALGAGPSPEAALAPLEEATMLEPRNPEVLVKLASLYEKLGQLELAQSTWKNLVALGPEAGDFLQVADIRLRLLEGDHPPAEPVGSSLRDAVGLQPGSTLGIVDLQVKDSMVDGAPIKDLRIAVKARPGESIDARDVRIDLTFYEMANGEVIASTGRARSMWYSTPVDWKGEGIEILEVKYEMPRGGDAGASQYYGYMVSIYHLGQLQETRSDPVDLQELFPPAPSENPGGAGAPQDFLLP